jgi:nucleotide-binding universal stress UspA family protein
VEGDVMKFERILVGVDGSENAARAVEVAGTLAALAGARVVALHAIGLLEGGGDAGHTPAERHDAVREAMERQWCKALAGAGLTISYELRDGNPVVVLLAVADEMSADLIVLGSRGLGGFPELLLGSTSTQVAQFAHCPVVIVPSSRRGEMIGPTIS